MNRETGRERCVSWIKPALRWQISKSNYRLERFSKFDRDEHLQYKTYSLREDARAWANIFWLLHIRNAGRDKQFKHQPETAGRRARRPGDSRLNSRRLGPPARG